MATHRNLHMNLTDDLSGQPFVDILISDYLKMEMILWNGIEHRADNILLQVFKNHERFFDDAMDKSGSNILASGILTNIEVLVDIDMNLNSITDLGRTHLKEQTLDRQSITEYSSHALKILMYAKHLYDHTKNDTLWENIITVSE